MRADGDAQTDEGVPYVMLSPNDRNRVALSKPTRVTVMLKPHEAAFCSASLAVHNTVVVPTTKFEPLGGLQVTVTGRTPPEAVARSKSTRTGEPDTDSALMWGGQLI